MPAIGSPHPTRLLLNYKYEDARRYSTGASDVKDVTVVTGVVNYLEIDRTITSNSAHHGALQHG
jgi:hypothetical protein